MIKQEPDFAGGVSVFIKWVLLAQRTRTQKTKHPKVMLLLALSTAMLTSGLAGAKEFYPEHWHWQEEYV